MKLSDAPHLKRAGGLLLAGGIFLAVTRLLLQPASFGLHDTNYREDSLGEIQQLPLVHQDVALCAACHTDIAQLHDKDVHFSVPCVTCHGPGDRHMAFHRDSSTAVSESQAAMPKEYTLEGCLFCHRRLKARPSDFPQQDPEAHYRQVHVTDSTTRCVECHSPHEPIFLSAEVKEARIHPVIRDCRECHETAPPGDHRAVAGHPVVFVCRDCHRAVVEDFSRKSHGPHLECRTCHLFHKENESAGRIYNVGKVRFCLMCHERKPFKDPNVPPKIDWPNHLNNVGHGWDPSKTVCIRCHEAQIHSLHLGVGGGTR